MKVALVSTALLPTPPTQHFGGVELVVADLAEALAKMGHDVTLFGADGSKVEGCKVFEFGPAPEEPEVKEAELEWKAFERYRNKFEVEYFDVINVHNPYCFEYAAKVDNLGLCVCHTHHVGFGRSLLFWRRTFPFLKLNVIADSKYTQEIFRKIGLSAKVVYLGINLTRFPYKCDKGERLVFIGRFNEGKQPHVAIRIAKKLGLGLDLMGSMWVRDREYLEKIKAMCDGEEIRMLPNAPHEVKVKLLQDAKALVFPSLLEGFGLVLVEAMSCGTPVVVLDNGPPQEIVKEGGFVCRNEEEMATAVEKVGDIEPQDCLLNAKRFSREIMANNYLKIYEEVLAGNSW